MKVLQFRRKREPTGPVQVRFEEEIRHARQLYHAGHYHTALVVLRTLGQEVQVRKYPLNHAMQQDVSLIVAACAEALKAKRIAYDPKGAA